ncbi:MAG: hypothetical protein ACREOM_06895, partial [Candidatus Dormibacteraceae bacterium]
TWGAPPGPSPFATPAAEPAYPPAAPPAPPDEPAPYQPPAYEPPAYPPPAEPAAPAEPAWTPAPAPAESMPLQSTPPAVPAAAGASWSIVGDSKDMSAGVEQAGKRDKKSPGTAAWQLASGEAPGTETEEVVKPPSATVAVAQYAILVAGLVMVLIGVLVMIANSHGT